MMILTKPTFSGIDRITSLVLPRLFFVLLGWCGAQATYHVQDLLQNDKQLHVEETKVIPQLKNKAGCEHWRANKAATVAQRAIVGANSDTAPIPDAKEIPTDNCDPPKK